MSTASEFVAYYREQLREPESFEHVRTLIYPVDENGQHELVMTYRARNGFGGLNLETVRAEIAISDCGFRLTTA